MVGKEKVLKVLVILILALTLTSFGCGTSDSKSRENNESRSSKEERVDKKVNDFLLELTAKQEIKSGNSLDMTLKVKNDTGQSKAVSYGSPRHHDFEIFDSEGNSVWCQTCKEFYIQTIEEEMLGADKEIEYSARWELEDNEGKVVEAGVYILKASWLALENGGSVEKKIEIIK